MSLGSITAKLLSGRSARWILKALTRLAYTGWLRRPAYQWLTNRLKSGPDKIDSQRKLLYVSILSTVDRLMERRVISPGVAGKSALLWARALLIPAGKVPAAVDFRRQTGVYPPWFITIGPGHRCNLECKSCYAASASGVLPRAASSWPSQIWSRYDFDREAVVRAISNARGKSFI